MISTPAQGIDSLFSAADRCDRCGARARMLALLCNGGRLLFCGHHAAVYRPMLEQVAVLFEDPTPIGTPPVSRFPAVTRTS